MQRPPQNIFCVVRGRSGDAPICQLERPDVKSAHRMVLLPLLLVAWGVLGGVVAHLLGLFLAILAALTGDAFAALTVTAA